jgi:alginate biosynthesis protein Alg44
MTAITHEAEAQRQHARYRIPLKCEIENRTLEVRDWSLGGAAVQGDVSGLKPKRIVKAKLVFPFDAFGMNLDVDAEVMRMDKEKGVAGLRFVNLSRQQANVLRFVIDAYVSGEVVTAGDIIEVSARHGEAQSRLTPEERIGMARRIGRFGGSLVRYTALGVCSLLLLGFLGLSLQDRLLTVRANSAVVTTDMVVLPAPYGGSVGFLSDQTQLKHGDPVAAIETVDGKSVFLNSPCDCVVHRRYASAGDYLTLGAPVVALRRADARPYIAAFVPFDRALQIMGGWRADVLLADGVRVKDAGLQFTPADDRREGAQLTKVIVNIDEELAGARLGQPARVTFEMPLLAGVEQHLPRSLLSLLGLEPGKKSDSQLASEPKPTSSPKL